MPSHIKPFQLKSQIILGAVLLFMTPAVVGGVVYTIKVQRNMEEAALTKLQERGEFAARQLAGFLFHQWTDVEALAGAVDISNPEKLRDGLKLAGQSHGRFAWIGVATLDGSVLASSNPLLDDLDVSKQPWFRRGLEGPHVGDVHEDLRLGGLMPERGRSPSQDAPRKEGSTPEPDKKPESDKLARTPLATRFVDMSTPVKGPDGQTVAVLGVHLDWRAAGELLNGLRADDIEIVVLSMKREILFQSGGGNESGLDVRLDKELAATAHSVAPVALIKHGDGGQVYLAAMIPDIRRPGLPSLGWSLVASRNARGVLVDAGRLVRTFWVTLGAGTILALAGVYTLASFIARPITAASKFAERLVKGDIEGLPPEPSGCREARSLGASLTRLQSRLIRRMSG